MQSRSSSSPIATNFGVGLTLAVVVGIFGMNVFHGEEHPNLKIDVFVLSFASGGVLAGFAALYAWADELEGWFTRKGRLKCFMISLPWLLAGFGLLGMLFR